MFFYAAWGDQKGLKQRGRQRKSCLLSVSYCNHVPREIQPVAELWRGQVQFWHLQETLGMTSVWRIIFLEKSPCSRDSKQPLVLLKRHSLGVWLDFHIRYPWGFEVVVAPSPGLIRGRALRSCLCRSSSVWFPFLRGFSLQDKLVLRWQCRLRSRNASWVGRFRTDSSFILLMAFPDSSLRSACYLPGILCFQTKEGCGGC